MTTRTTHQQAEARLETAVNFAITLTATGRWVVDVLLATNGIPYVKIRRKVTR